MKIFLKTLELKNFKGIKKKKIDFTDKTYISGKNATGKTTVFDGYMWLLWGKDSKSRKDYEIKPYELTGENKHNLDCTVEALIEVDEKEIKLKRVYKEKWTKKKGSTLSEFNGNTTKYYINDEEKKLKEYTEFVNKLVTEDEFNLLSNPLYFNEVLDYKKRREILFSLIDDVGKDEVIKENPELKELDFEDHDLDGIRNMAKAACKSINEELTEIPARIDELENMKTTEDFEDLEVEKEKLEISIKRIEECMVDTSKSTEAIKEKSKQITELENKRRKIISEYEETNRKGLEKVQEQRLEIKKKISVLEFEIDNNKDLYSKKLKSINANKEDIKKFEKQVEKAREEWVETNSKKNTDDFKCPTCGQDLPEDQIEEIKKKFNLNKAKELESITEKAKKQKAMAEEAKEDVEKKEKELEELKAEVEKQNEKRESLEKSLLEIKDFDEIEKPKEIDEIDLEIKAIEESLSDSQNNQNLGLISKKNELSEELDLIKNKLANKGLNESIKTKIQNYMDREKELNKQYEQKQRILNLCDEYTRIYAELVSGKINDLFEFAEFKLFDTQINGGIKETAEATYKGVPYGTLNNASTYNIGLDIINALSKKLDKYLPIFVDNAESVNEFIKTNTQIIELRVTEDKELKIC